MEQKPQLVAFGSLLPSQVMDIGAELDGDPRAGYKLLLFSLLGKEHIATIAECLGEQVE